MARELRVTLDAPIRALPGEIARDRVARRLPEQRVHAPISTGVGAHGVPAVRLVDGHFSTLTHVEPLRLDTLVRFLSKKCVCVFIFFSLNFLHKETNVDERSFIDKPARLIIRFVFGFCI